jgi:hypothetical protein
MDTLGTSSPYASILLEWLTMGASSVFMCNSHTTRSNVGAKPNITRSNRCSCADVFTAYWLADGSSCGHCFTWSWSAEHVAMNFEFCAVDWNFSRVNSWTTTQMSADVRCKHCVRPEQKYGFLASGHRISKTTTYLFQPIYFVGNLSSYIIILASWLLVHG